MLPAAWAFVGTAAALIAVAGVQTVRLASVGTELEQERADRAAERATAAQARASESERYRALEAADRDRLLEALRTNRKAVDQAHADADVARVEHGRLHDAARAAAARRCTTTAATAAATASLPATDTAVLLADVLGRIDARAGDLARHADQLAAAGVTCVESVEVAP